MLGDITISDVVVCETGTMRGRCGAPDLAPPALAGSRGDETPVHAPDIGVFAGPGYCGGAPPASEQRTCVNAPQHSK